MKFLTYLPTESPAPRLGVLLADHATVCDLGRAAEQTGHPAAPYADLITLWTSPPTALTIAQELLAWAEQTRPANCCFPLTALEMLSPVPRPASIRDCMAYERHVIQATRAFARWKFWPAAVCDAWSERWLGRPLLSPTRVWSQRPIYYKGNPRSVVGTGATIEWPAWTQRLDYELELGIFIGRVGRDIPVERAAEYIGGYTLFNDFTARDVQLEEIGGHLGPAKSKDFETGNALGPWLVTPDEMPDLAAVELTATINGQVWSRGTAGGMRFTFPQIIAYLSQSETLYPGDFIGGGTIGSGCGLELDRWLQPGDVIELRGTGLGTLSNVIARP